MVNELNPKKDTIVFGEDSVVIQKLIADINGGRTLDVTAVTENVIKAGHVIVCNADGVYKPLGITDGKYDALGEGEAYAGVLYRSILKENPAASIMVAGVVNKALLPAPIPEGALPHIMQTEDIEA